MRARLLTSVSHVFLCTRCSAALVPGVDVSLPEVESALQVVASLVRVRPHVRHTSMRGTPPAVAKPSAVSVGDSYCEFL